MGNISGDRYRMETKIKFTKLDNVVQLETPVLMTKGGEVVID